MLLQGGDREQAARQFTQIESALRRYSDPLDPRLLLARVGAACARGQALLPELAAALAQPPQPDYLGYAWLRDAPCPELRDSAAARHSPPQDYAFGEELRAALDAAAARLGECRDGHRVAIGGSCASSRRLRDRPAPAIATADVSVCCATAYPPVTPTTGSTPMHPRFPSSLLHAALLAAIAPRRACRRVRLSGPAR
ncbi:MAG: hypothetical protein IPH76_09895 [Xanthomonadales bacterium]|nr:hypothetical protein [Xanthomonadales bacterium]